MIDLSSQSEVVFALLSRADEWRVRTVDQFLLSSDLACSARRSIQVAPLASVLNDVPGVEVSAASESTKVRLILPVGVLPNRPLVGFDVLVDQEPAYLLTKVDIADIEARYVQSFFHDLGVSREIVEFIGCLCEFTPGQWIQQRSRNRPRVLARQLLSGSGSLGSSSLRDAPKVGSLRRRILVHLLKNFITDSLGSTFNGINEVGTDLMAEWVDLSIDVGQLLDGVLEEPFDVDSSASLCILAIPLLAQREVVKSVGEITAVMKKFVDFCHDLKYSNDAQGRQALMVIAEYGRRWEVLVEATVPVNRPFLVSICEQRPARIFRGRWTEQQAAIGEARSSHVTFEVDGDSVDISKFRALDVYGAVARTFFNEGRFTREAVVIYSSEKVRPYLIWVKVKLRVNSGILWFGRLTEALTLFGIAILCTLSSRTKVADMILLVTPTTFATAVLLTRERSTVAARLLVWGRRRLLLFMTILWGILIYLYLSNQVIR